ncbi:MAG: SLBB domain-containing protein [Candidatus Kapabacteria bacterium]|nr:SLBB domain-containing protein [Ignavibacteriota bacterium]MCW5885182.1 SLBB domain-containing protein [Candidatus Kapabacteria bacterium]
MIKKIILLMSFFLLLPIGNIELSAQVKKPERGRLSGATKDAIDTLAAENARVIVKENKGLLEREIIPDKYIMGPGDVLIVSIIGIEAIAFEAPVSPEGKIMLKGAGSIDAKNKTLKETQNLIKEQISRFYKSEKIDVALKEIRQFKVIVSGKVPKPISVSSTAADRASEAIEKAGGLLFEASERNISLIRREQNEIIPVDLIKFFTIGDENANPTLMGGDLIRVPSKNEVDVIEIFGEVIDPGEFEFVEGDSLSTLFKFAQGFLSSALLDSVEFARKSEAGQNLTKRYLNLKSWKGKLFSGEPLEGDFLLKSGDRVYIRKIPKWQDNNYVIVEGEVLYPGKYPIREEIDRVSNVISRAGGFTDKAEIKNIEFIRQLDMDKKDPEIERLSRLNPSEMSKTELRYFQAKITEKKGAMSLNFETILNAPDSEEDIVLMNMDSIIVPSKNQFVNIQGRVNNPGKVRFQEGLLYSDYIQIAGGYAFRADIDETFITKPRGGQFLARKLDYAIEPGDVILVPTQTDVSFMETFTIALTIATQLVTIAGVIIAIMNLR